MFLTLDSALGSGSAAIAAEGRVLAFREITEKGAQAKKLVTIIEQALADAGTAYNDLKAIYCTTGPGGFTGIRIALATARAIGFTSSIPVHGVSTLACLAYAHQKACMCILPAGKGMVYAQSFDDALKPIAEPSLFPVAELTQVALPLITATASDIFDIGEAHLAKITLDAKLLASLIMDKAAEHLLTLPEPLYIRPPDITQPAA